VTEHRTAVGDRNEPGGLGDPADLDELLGSFRDRLRRLVPAAPPRRAVAEAVEVVDAADGAALAGELVAGCRRELLVLQPRLAEPALAPRWYEAARRRGARVRTIYQNAARYHLPTEGFVAAVAGPGVEFRTVAELPVTVLAADRLAALLPGEDGPAVLVRHPLLVEPLARVAEEAWARATPFDPADPQPAGTAEDTRLAVLRLLATGAKDDAVARRLGMSVRTCRRHVAELLEALGAGSRFQAGVEAARRRLI
jgi:DNA-binding CsgD family transcriptional regulator